MRENIGYLACLLPNSYKLWGMSKRLIITSEKYCKSQAISLEVDSVFNRCLMYQWYLSVKDWEKSNICLLPKIYFEICSNIVIFDDLLAFNCPFFNFEQWISFKVPRMVYCNHRSLMISVNDAKCIHLSPMFCVLSRALHCKYKL